MRVNMAEMEARLSKAGKRPEEAFPWFRLSREDVDRGEVVDLSPRDEAGIIAGTTEPAHAAALRTTLILSCSAATHEELVRALERKDRHRTLYLSDQSRIFEAAKRGETVDPRIEATFDEEKPRGAIIVLVARVLAEGIEKWAPPPRARVAIPILKVKRGDPIPDLGGLLPENPSDYTLAANAKLVEAYEALPNYYAERVFTAILWLSQLMPSRFLSERRQESDAGKPSASPSRSPSSAPGGASGSSGSVASEPPATTSR